MTDTPTQATDYRAEDLDLVKAGCLTVATKLGGLMDQIVIVGGYVPRLLIDLARDQESFSEWDASDVVRRHVGTRDLDLGFAVGLLDEEHYREIAAQLRQAGFEPDINVNGNPTHQRWRFRDEHRLKLDFLIPPLSPGDEEKGGQLQHLDHEFAACIIPGLTLAFESPLRIELEGRTLRDAHAKRTINVCAPAPFIVLKALAIDNRGKDKDEYDLFYVLRNHPQGVAPIAETFAGFVRAKSAEARSALEILERDFATNDSVGPVAVSRFVHGYNEPSLQADAAAFVLDFVEKVKGAGDA